MAGITAASRYKRAGVAILEGRNLHLLFPLQNHLELGFVPYLG